MSDNLYTSKSDHGLLKMDHVERALHHEKLKGNLHIDSAKIGHFMDSFGKALQDREWKVGHQVTPKEVEDTLHFMKTHSEYHGHMTRQEIDHISEVLANHDSDTQ